MDKYSLYGAGFIGGHYVNAYPDEVSVEDGSKTPLPKILYMISTIHNYHIKDGDYLRDIDTNLVRFMTILKGAHEAHGDKLEFNLVSTWFVYGKTQMPAREDSACNPTGFYSITARAREQLLISYCETFGLKYRILRLGNVIGIGDKKISPRKNALQYMVRELAQGREINLYKGGAIRDYIDVRDCVRAIHLVLEKGELNQIYNIANGHGLNVEDLVKHAHAACKYTGKINTIPVPDFHRVVQTPTMWMDVSKLKALGYIQQYDIHRSVAGLAEYYKNEA